MSEKINKKAVQEAFQEACISYDEICEFVAFRYVVGTDILHVEQYDENGDRAGLAKVKLDWSEFE